MSRLLKILIYFPILWNGFLFTGLAFGQRERQLNGLGKYSKHHLGDKTGCSTTFAQYPSVYDLEYL